MKITWLGTAGFRVESEGCAFLIDPYLSRNGNALPVQPLGPADMSSAECIFVSHGHFDHVYDVPEIALNTDCEVYCCKLTADLLEKRGVGRDRIHGVLFDGHSFDFGGWEAAAFFSKHVRFDRRLMVRTFTRIHFRLPRYLPLVKEYPEGQVLSWQFTIEGKTIHHFGSGGSSSGELEALAKKPTDILLVPLQGHTRICDLALEYVRALRPKKVIPHHFDDFFPPISTMINIKPFIEGVDRACQGTEVIVPRMNEPVLL